MLFLFVKQNPAGQKEFVSCFDNIFCSIFIINFIN